MKYFSSRFWFFLSIITSILFSIAGLKLAFQTTFTIQDDARQHIFWMQQFNDHSLFNDDLIADYFQSIAPEGFTILYRLVNSLGIDIFFFNKFSPLLIGLVTSIYCFRLCLTIFPVPWVGFLSTLLLNQNLWMVDDLSSGTPRAFIYPLFLAFIYYLLKQDLWLCLLVIILQGLFYPQTVLLSAIVLLIRLFCQTKINSLTFIEQKQTKLYYCCLITALVVLFFYSWKTSSFDPIITREQAQLMPEFTSQGRSAFFGDNLVDFWLLGRRSGWLPIEWQYTLICSAGLIILWLKEYPHKFPLVKKINHKAGILLQIIIASTILFFLAHLFLFRLHLPSRYIHHSLRIILALLDAIAIAVIYDRAIRWLNFNFSIRRKFSQHLGRIILITLLLLPTYAVQSYPHRLGYITGTAPKLYQFLQEQPSDYLVATISSEGDHIPSFAARSVLVAAEYAIPYHQGYYQPIRQRTKDLIAAQYSLDPQIVSNFINKYGVNLWLLDTGAFSEQYLTNNQWLQQFTPEITEATLVSKSKQQPILSQIRDRCIIFQTKAHIIWETSCLVQELDKISSRRRRKSAIYQ